MAFKASGRELWVGSDRQYSHLHDAVAAAQDGDTIYVEAGVYENDFSTIRDSVHIVGVGGMAHFKNTESSIDNGKAIFVVRDADVVIQNLEFSGAKVSDHNGAGIRFESGSLRVEDSYFHHNENGILAGTSNGRITVDNSEFAYNGRGDGYTHGIYAGKIDSLTVTDSYFHDTRAGHHIKSRADETTIVNNRLMDAGGDASYNIDLPNGNDAVIRHNVIEQSADSDNRTMVHYGGEASSYSGSLIVDDNVFISHGGNSVGVRNQTPITARIEDNTFHNVDKIAVGPSSKAHNTVYDDLSHVGDLNLAPAPEQDSAPAPDSTSDSSDASLLVRVSGDDYRGDPQFSLYVDGHKIGSTETVTADHGQGEWQTFKFTGDFGADGPDEVAVRFSNDAWGGSSGADRNLYVDYIELGGTRIQAEDAVYERSNGHTLHGQQEMSWNGSLVFDTHDVSLLGVASHTVNDGMTG